MIQLLKRSQIDEQKYNYCIVYSLQSRIYAYSWYLDIVADNWDVLVLNDYEAVMPLPWKRKYGLKYITQPFFCQQLGVFSINKLKEADVFIKNIPNNFFKVRLQLNSSNEFKSENKIIKTNYILSLNKTYNVLFKNFSKGRKHALNQGLKNECIIQEIDFQDVLTLSRENYSFKEILDKDYQKLSKLINTLKEKERVEVIGVKRGKELIGGSVFLLDSKRITYLFSAISKRGKEKQVGSLLINSIIEKYAQTDMVLDFEGSQIPGIASFFKSFGAEIENYFLFKKRLL